MSISPFNARPAPSGGGTPEIGQRRARLAIAIAIVGIAATLLAYAISPGVRHAVSHAAHSVNHAVGRMLDHDVTKVHRQGPVHAVHPLQPRGPAPASGRSVSTTTSR
jgi:type II secretory pathway pseudopilin PulG